MANTASIIPPRWHPEWTREWVGKDSNHPAVRMPRQARSPRLEQRLVDNPSESARKPMPRQVEAMVPVAPLGFVDSPPLSTFSTLETQFAPKFRLIADVTSVGPTCWVRTTPNDSTNRPVRKVASSRGRLLPRFLPSRIRGRLPVSRASRPLVPDMTLTDWRAAGTALPPAVPVATQRRTGICGTRSFGGGFRLFFQD